MKLIHVLAGFIFLALTFGGCTTTQQEESMDAAAMGQADEDAEPAVKKKKNKKGKKAKKGKKGKKGKKKKKKKKAAEDDEG
jgi:prophage tail gpP-like protein